MKKLIKRLSRVADSTTQYCLLRSSADSGGGDRRQPGRAESFRASMLRRSSCGVPAGHVPVYVGDEMARFVVSAELLNHPVFVGLLDKSAREYGYEQKGALKIPCLVPVFERVLEALRLGAEPHDIQDLVAALSIDEDC